MRIILTGATGAIGMALIQEAVKQNHEVLILCHKESKRSSQIPQQNGIRVVCCDLEEMGSCTKEDLGISGETDYDVFFHFAWAGTTGASRNDMPLQIQNIKYTMDAVELARKLGCHTFIGAGSQAEYGRVEGKLTDKTPAFPENGYGMAKLCAGQMSRQRCEMLGMRHIWTRILSVYGPYDGPQSMISLAIQKMLAGERASFTEGMQKWDYLYSGDAARAMLALAENGKDGQTYVLGSGEVRELRDYISQIKELVLQLHGSTGSLGLGDIPYGEKQVMHLQADISKLTEDTGFQPETSFQQGIADTIRYWL